MYHEQIPDPPIILQILGLIIFFILFMFSVIILFSL
jgi:hypothetical protein